MDRRLVVISISAVAMVISSVTSASQSEGRIQKTSLIPHHVKPLLFFRLYLCVCLFVCVCVWGGGGGIKDLSVFSHQFILLQYIRIKIRFYHQAGLHKQGYISINVKDINM